ncbi:MAG: DnaJ domain-containing protein, partial [Spirochaetales bacterium]|nr:DnaJ domain-containing protein [Spirochaetales bacterium]
DFNEHVCRACLVLTGPLKKAGWQEIYDIFSGKISEETIADIATDLEYDTSELRIKNSAMIEEKLKVLGLQRGASIEEISSAFKRLSLRVHPDTIANKELDDEFVQYANKRFREIKEAYDYLKMNY